MKEIHDKVCVCERERKKEKQREKEVERKRNRPFVVIDMIILMAFVSYPPYLKT